MVNTLATCIILAAALQQDPCPTYRVEATPLVPKATTRIQFVAYPSYDPNAETVYEWRVSEGSIVGGQGGNRIEVLLPDGFVGDVKATLNVRGRAPNCSLLPPPPPAEGVTSVGTGN